MFFRSGITSRSDACSPSLVTWTTSEPRFSTMNTRGFSPPQMIRFTFHIFYQFFYNISACIVKLDKRTFLFRLFDFNSSGSIFYFLNISDHPHLELAISKLRLRADGSQSLCDVCSVPPHRRSHCLGLARSDCSSLGHLRFVFR